MHPSHRFRLAPRLGVSTHSPSLSLSVSLALSPATASPLRSLISADFMGNNQITGSLAELPRRLGCRHSVSKASPKKKKGLNVGALIYD